MPVPIATAGHGVPAGEAGPQLREVAALPLRRLDQRQRRVEEGVVVGRDEHRRVADQLHEPDRRLGESLGFESLARLTNRLAELAREVARPPIQLVKMIGDAAMLVSPENDAVLAAALQLIDAVEAEGEAFPQLRAGLARGDAVGRGGDWYGRPVNLASRITSIAYPTSALCSKSVRDAAGAGFRWSFAGERRLKGIDGRIRLFRARRADEAA